MGHFPQKPEIAVDKKRQASFMDMTTPEDSSLNGELQERNRQDHQVSKSIF